MEHTVHSEAEFNEFEPRVLPITDSNCTRAQISKHGQKIQVEPAMFDLCLVVPRLDSVQIL